VARALIVGCGCRGRMLGGELLADGWQVRGTSRTAAGIEAIDGAGIDAARADPDRAGEILELVGDVAVVVWALGSAAGEAEEVAALHGPRLERMLELLVDTPVRGFVYEAAGSVPGEALDAGTQVVLAAGERWRIPVAPVTADPGDARAWASAVADAVRGVVRA
jgi:hypothetical protein